MMTKCIFCQIAQGKAPAHIIWKDKKHMAFLGIFPNTDGFTVLIPKKHYSSYFAEVDSKVVCDLLKAAQKVAKLLDKKLVDVGRTGLIFEGFGVDHLHAKLIPMHGTADMTKWKPITSKNKKFFKKYEGYISTHDYKRASDEKLAKLADQIRKI